MDYTLLHVKKRETHLLIVDNAVLLVVCFDARKLHHEVHEVRAALLTLQEHRFTFLNLFVSSSVARKNSELPVIFHTNPNWLSNVFLYAMLIFSLNLCLFLWFSCSLT